MKHTTKTAIIIHLFALLHPAVATICRWAGVMDEIWLTMFTIAMVVLICIRESVKVEVIAASVILMNVAGYIIGVYGARLLALMLQSEMLVHAISTFVTTEIIGWSTAGLLKVFRKDSAAESRQTARPAPPDIKKVHIIWLTVAIVLILLFRTTLTLLFTDSPSNDRNLPFYIETLFSNTGIPVAMLCLTIMLVRYIRIKRKDWSSPAKTIAVMGFCLIIAGVLAAAAGMIYLDGDGSGIPLKEYAQLSIVAFAAEIISYSIIYMIDYAYSIRAEMYAAKEQARQAEFQYTRLKQQVNPHFLFNSLNILDCMVRDGQNDKASSYIHKLAGIYRYMLKHEDTTVPLKDEMDFVEMYIDLLKERFGDGFDVITDIPKETMPLKVIPCSVQMLVENAIKHNIVGGKEPLHISISAGNGSLAVANSLRPKINEGESTKIGLNNMRKQYLDLYGKDITVSSANGIFIVTIPLSE